HVLDAKPDDWSPLYAKVSGVLPSSDVFTAAAVLPGRNQKGISARSIVYLRGDFEVTAEGPITLTIGCPPDTAAWLDADPYEGDSVHRITSKLPIGNHTIVLRVPTQSQDSQPDASIKVELAKPAASSAQFQPVGGI